MRLRKVAQALEDQDPLVTELQARIDSLEAKIAELEAGNGQLADRNTSLIGQLSAAEKLVKTAAADEIRAADAARQRATEAEAECARLRSAADQAAAHLARSKEATRIELKELTDSNVKLAADLKVRIEFAKHPFGNLKL